MDSNVLFTKALGLGPGLKVVTSEIDVVGRELRLRLDFERGARFPCAKCGQFCPVHDTVERKWRHLEFWQHSTELSARIDCQFACNLRETQAAFTVVEADFAVSLVVIMAAKSSVGGSR